MDSSSHVWISKFGHTRSTVAQSGIILNKTKNGIRRTCVWGGPSSYHRLSLSLSFSSLCCSSHSLLWFFQLPCQITWAKTVVKQEEGIKERGGSVWSIISRHLNGLSLVLSIHTVLILFVADSCSIYCLPTRLPTCLSVCSFVQRMVGKPPQNVRCKVT